MTEIINLEGKNVAEARREFLEVLHPQLQRFILKFIPAIAICLYTFSAMSDPCWQNWVMLSCIVAMSAVWFVGYRFALKAQLGLSVMLFVLPVITLETVEMCIVEGTMTTAILGNLVVTIYASLFSRKSLYTSAILTGVSLALAESVRFFAPESLKVVPPDERFIVQLVFIVLFVPLIAFILRRSQRTNDALFGGMAELTNDQGKIIAAIKEMQPAIDAAAAGIRQVSNSFAVQASEQAAATAEVGAVMANIKRTASQTATKADSTHNTAEKTRQESLISSSQLKQVEQGFNEVVQKILGTRSVVADLSSRAENIEEILGSNRAIGAQIKILAINAAMEAAKAGKAGMGFRVVAGELRTLIHRIDENLEHSRRQLESIQTQAQESADTIDESSKLLQRHFDDLRATGLQIEHITDNVVKTSEHISQIAQAARKQQTSIIEVSSAMAQIDKTASQLEQSGSILMENVGKIVGSHDSLREILPSNGK
jgi:methyl-accepting chemotaxis protein